MSAKGSCQNINLISIIYAKYEICEKEKKNVFSSIGEKFIDIICRGFNNFICLNLENAENASLFT